jgi:hypothetical protein
MTRSVTTAIAILVIGEPLSSGIKSSVNAMASFACSLAAVRVSSPRNACARLLRRSTQAAGQRDITLFHQMLRRKLSEFMMRIWVRRLTDLVRFRVPSHGGSCRKCAPCHWACIFICRYRKRYPRSSVQPRSGRDGTNACFGKCCSRDPLAVQCSVRIEALNDERKKCVRWDMYPSFSTRVGRTIHVQEQQPSWK